MFEGLKFIAATTLARLNASMLNLRNHQPGQ